jgi:hypothetical protein
MATSASFHGVVGLQNPSRYQIDRKPTEGVSLYRIKNRVELDGSTGVNGR